MLKIIASKIFRFGQSFLDEVDQDWRRGEPEAPPQPHGPQGVINETNYEYYEPTKIDEPIEEHIRRPVEPAHEHADQNIFEDQPRPEEEIPQQEGIEYDVPLQLVYDGIDNEEIISFDYTNRFGQYAGTRKVEPHYTFVAETTGNEVLVTFDHTKGDIRAFIVSNIHPYGVRYEGERFEPKDAIMRGIY